MALILGLDVSSSVDADEDRLQRNGLATALLAPEVKQAFFASDMPVALSVFEWSGRYNQEVLLNWTMINSSAALGFAAEKIASSRRSHNEFPTAMGYALGFASGLFKRAPGCLFKTIDMAGDGSNNEGFPPSAAYAEFDFADVTVNGLVVNAAEFESETQLIDFYKSEVLFGAGAFLEVAQGFQDYERAMRRKLEREVRPPSIGDVGFDRLYAPG
ncbi:MAG: DUF1194 domain-containing protein [Paracoccaceae bacterium]